MLARLDRDGSEGIALYAMEIRSINSNKNAHDNSKKVMYQLINDVYVI